MLTLAVLWILFLLVTIYDNQTELLLQTKLQLQIKKKNVSGQAQRKAIPLKLTRFWKEKWGRGRREDYAS